MVQISAIPTSDKAAAKKREILQAASRVFRRQGLHAAGMRDIAAELGMHAGNLYYYFANKQELLAFCQQDALSGLLDLAAEVRQRDLPTDDKLRLLIAGHIELLNERTPGSLAHLEVEALEGQWRHVIQARRDRYERTIRGFIKQGISEGVFRHQDPQVATMVILGAVNWTVKWFRHDGRKSASRIGREFAELLIGGLAKGAAA